jgi:hypothetical protein
MLAMALDKACGAHQAMQIAKTEALSKIARSKQLKGAVLQRQRINIRRDQRGEDREHNDPNGEGRCASHPELLNGSHHGELSHCAKSDSAKFKFGQSKAEASEGGKVPRSKQATRDRSGG